MGEDDQIGPATFARLFLVLRDVAKRPGTDSNNFILRVPRVFFRGTDTHIEISARHRRDDGKGWAIAQVQAAPQPEGPAFG